MYAVNSAHSLLMNYYFFLGLHTALHVKVGLLQHTMRLSSRPMVTSCILATAAPATRIMVVTWIGDAADLLPEDCLQHAFVTACALAQHL